MSNLPPLALPRFHVNGLSQSRKSQTASAQNLPADTAFAEVSDDQKPDADASEAAEPVDLPAEPRPPEIDTGTILNSLELAVAGLEKAALTHSQNRVSEFLQAAFPNLCEAFLADEIVRAAEAMAPNEIERLVLSIPAAFEPAFHRAVAGSPKMSEICELQARETGDDIVIDVDWRTGGLHFDMSQFLESSLARLAGPTHTHEGHNV